MGRIFEIKQVEPDKFNITLGGHSTKSMDADQMMASFSEIAKGGSGLGSKLTDAVPEISGPVAEGDTVLSIDRNRGQYTISAGDKKYVNKDIGVIRAQLDQLQADLHTHNKNDETSVAFSNAGAFEAGVFGKSR